MAKSGLQLNVRLANRQVFLSKNGDGFCHIGSHALDVTALSKRGAELHLNGINASSSMTAVCLYNISTDVVAFLSRRVPGRRYAITFLLQVAEDNSGPGKCFPS
jgi:hypothetical protein